MLVGNRSRCCYCWSNILNFWLCVIGMIHFEMSYSFQHPVHTKFASNMGRKSNRFITSINQIADSDSISLNEVKNTGKSSVIPDKTRRTMLALSSIALSLLEQPVNANAAAEPKYNPNISLYDAIPFSSVRKQQVITLSNGLRVLMVNDKRASQSTAALVVAAGQFQDFDDLPGTAHLMEHMVLSYNNNSGLRKQDDFENWLSENEGSSNAFTAYEQTCFHLNCPHHVLPRALERFATLFLESNVVDVCHNPNILAREIRRVDSELDLDTMFAQIEYVTKCFVNSEHPYFRFSRGNVESLETTPAKRGIKVAELLISFFRKYYLPSRAVLTIVTNQEDMSSIRRWAAPFSVALSPNKPMATRDIPKHYPGRFLVGNRRKHLILHDGSAKIGEEKLILQWVLNQDYRGPQKNDAIEIAFVLNQILGRRGPGSLNLFLRQQGWIQNSSAIPPRVSVDLNVSGFQILKLEMSLTFQGFLDRCQVVAAVYHSIDALRNPAFGFVIPREIMAQYATTAKLFGYTLTPRPSDAVELAVDSMRYGVNTVQSGKWYRFPSTGERGGLEINYLRRAVSSALSTMLDQEKALIIVTAGTKAMAQTSVGKNSIPPLSSSKWNKEIISGARVYFEDMLPPRSRLGQVLLSNGHKEELLPPVYNPFVLTSLSPVRPPQLAQASPASQRSNGNSNDPWRILTPGNSKLPLPRAPPETNCRCAFVVQLLSARPLTASAEEAANGELWRLSFDTLAKDLAELGAPGGLAYELRFNQYGLRMSFLGLSKTLPSYARRLTRLLVNHQHLLSKGPKILPNSTITTALSDIEKARGLPPSRKRIIVTTLQKASSHDAAAEGLAFLQSCKSAVCFSEGDLLPDETEKLSNDLQMILKDSISIRESDSIKAEDVPSIDDLISTPVWKPRNASPCYVAGVTLMSDACGRVLR